MILCDVVGGEDSWSLRLASSGLLPVCLFHLLILLYILPL